MSLPAQLTPAEYAPLAGVTKRTVNRMIERGEFPAGAVVRIGLSKHYRHNRLLTARLIDAGWLRPDAVLA